MTVIGGTIGAYERFLRMPPTFVMGIMWLVGALLLGALVMAAYSAETALSATMGLL